MKESASGKTFQVVNATLLTLIGAFMLFPFLYVFAVSFSSYKEFIQADFLIWPKQWVFDAYDYIFKSDAFIRSIFFTIYVTILGTIVNLLFTSSMGYALSRPVVGRKPVLVLVLFALLFPAGLIPTYIVVKETGLINSIWALILPVAISPFNLIVMRQFFLSIPGEVVESAVMDGATDLGIFARIVLPLSKPALAAFGLFYAVGHWNNYFGGLLYMNSPEKWPVQVVLRQLVVVNETNTLRVATEMVEQMPPPETIQMAALLVATVPILIVYPFLQKHFAKGVMLGAVKG
ncbi:carbohydrate ABC transporter permease [Paenibacillus antri]|uniref:Carbohydrate ABC transporter permease n=1 Tax=Paenibacillus antri TaxID=2582848 RepID=A0A5R9GC16_9BACL|nr:carbohydrate ABC transporter permease [Paenibacillus antri]TLS51600.1 carbohydrate ABC transporter permease [Paenibacillus antri]